MCSIYNNYKVSSEDIFYIITAVCFFVPTILSFIIGLYTSLHLPQEEF